MFVSWSHRFAIVSLLAWSAGAYGAPRERDDWYAYVKGDVRYGFQHIQVSKLPDGSFLYVSETRMLVDVLGVQRQEISGRSESIVTPTLRPISLSSELTQMSGVSRAVGRTQGDELTVTLNRVGTESTATFRFSESEPTILGICLDDWLASLPAGTEEATTKLLDDDSWRVQTATVKLKHRDADGSAWELNIDGGQSLGIVRLDADGAVLEKVFEVPQVHLKRCTADEAADLDYYTFDGRDLLTFSIDKVIAAPHRLTSLTVKLEWEDVPFEEFELQDDRQKLVERFERDGKFAAVVKISPPAAISEQTVFPVTGTEYRPYLAETHFIKPDDSKIAKAARRAVAGQKTALEATRSLSKWVHGYIEGGMIAETLSGPEVLASKQGKCTEYSTLFASLARSVGIPTRIVLGERMMGTQWIGHMWNEAYVGRWIPVDASVNEVGESFGLLKFIHSDTVQGTQPLRWKITNSLEISITDYALSPSSLANEYKTGVEGHVYTNVDHACRIISPVKGWELEDESEPGVVTVRFKIPEADDALIYFLAFALPPNTPPKSLTDARLNLFKSSYEGFKEIKNEPCTVAGSVGHTLSFSRVTEGEPPGSYVTTEYVWVHESAGYLLNLIATDKNHVKYLPDFMKLLAGFTHLSD